MSCETKIIILFFFISFKYSIIFILNFKSKSLNISSNKIISLKTFNTAISSIFFNKNLFIFLKFLMKKFLYNHFEKNSLILFVKFL